MEMIYKKAITTLTFLILMTSLLMITMFFNQDMLSFYRAIHWQKKNYLQNDVILLNISRQQAMAECEKLSLDNDNNIHRLVFKATETNEQTSHFAWCERVYLFKQSPTKAINEKSFTLFIEPTQIAKFIYNIANYNLQKMPVYWFSNLSTEWEINENIKGIVVSEGDLYIKGKGEIRGAIITKGELRIGEQVKLIYNKKIVSEIRRSYSAWRLAKKSWYDFESL